MLNSILLVICVCIVVVLIFFLFYWNRCIAYILASLFRFSFWNQGDSSIWLDIESIQFSVLGGRILFKNLRYHSSNQTIIILKGQLSWRYWIRAPAQEADLSSVGGLDGDLSSKPGFPSCRIHITLHGLEWFVYNRIASYENIITSLGSSLSHAAASNQHQHTDGRGTLSRSLFGSGPVPGCTASLFAPPSSLVLSLRERTPAFVKRGWGWLVEQLPNLDPKDLLPLSLEINTAAITIGNVSTPTLLVTEFHKAHGTYGIVPSRSKHDQYKQSLKLTFQNASIRYTDNTNHNSNMQREGQKFSESIRSSDSRNFHHLSHLSFPTFSKLWRHLRLWRVLPSRPKSHISVHALAAHAIPFQDRHKQNADTKEDASVVEYAEERKILETSILELHYYADVVGVVPPQHVNTDGLHHDSISGNLPPEWGIELVMHGGFVRYGPWADRKRVELQHTFFPPNYTDYDPHKPSKPGEFRVWTSLQIFMELRDGVTLQVPFREASKNWMWDGKVRFPGRPRIREAASIHIRAGDRSTINYVIPMVPGPTGFEPNLEIHIDTVSITSSLNDIQLLGAESCRIRCDLPSPLKWRDERRWTFAVSFRRPTLYLLRDHINMLTDLGRDWSSGPHVDHHRFIPMVYAVNFDFQNFEITTNLNDQNIIDKPLIQEENALLILRSAQLRSNIHIPLTKYRPDSTMVSFWIDVPDLTVSLTLPRWNTHSLFSTPHRAEVGRSGKFYLDASYRYYSEVNTENIDRLRLNFSAAQIVYKACGWTIRHFMVLRDNYFGSFTHFSTLNEYLEKKDRGYPLGDPISLQYREGSSNIIQVELALDIAEGLMVLPAGLPGYEVYNLTEAYNLDNIDIGESMTLRIPSLQLQLRTHEFYMDMSLNVDLISGHVQHHCSEKLWPVDSKEWNKAEAFVIDNLDITANRLFGPQPHTSTYICVWEIHLGAVRSTLSVADGRILAAAVGAFGLNFSDPLNAPAAEFCMPIDPDVTFVKLSIDQVYIVWQVDKAAMEIAFPDGVKCTSNDVPGKLHRKTSSLRLPRVYTKLLLASRKHPCLWYEVATTEADVNLDIYSSPDGWHSHAMAQEAFVSAQDVLTGRVDFLYRSESDSDKRQKSSGRGIVDSDLYLPLLRVPRNGASVGARELKLRERISMSPSYQLPLIFPPSDSEEEVFSEADRDARLANSRPPPYNSTSHQDQESMSSGDESDDDDLTDEEDSDSSDIPDGDCLGPSQPASEFANLSARYFAHHLSSPLLWYGSPFQCVKDRSSSFRHFLHKPRPASDAGMESSIGIDFGLDGLGDVTTFHVGSTNGIYLFLTPLAFSAVSSLLADIGANRLSPELRIDDMLASQVKSSVPKTEVLKKATLLNVNIPVIQLISSYSLVPEEELPSTDAAIGNTIPLPRSLTSIVATLDGVCVKGQVASAVGPPRPKLFTSCESASITLDAHGHGPGGHARSASCMVSARTWIKLADGSVSLVFAPTVTRIEHSAPRLLALCIDSLTCSIEGTYTTYYRNVKESSLSDQQLIRRVLFSSRDKVIIDPLSTIQPSYLVQTGRPRQLRLDPTFRFLIYLRNCLRYMGADERLTLTGLGEETPPKFAIEDLVRLMENDIIQGDVDPSYRDSAILGLVFPDINPLSHPKDHPEEFPLEAVHLLLEDFRVILHHPGNHFQSEVDVGRFEVTLHQRSTDWAKIASPISKRSFATLSSRVDAPHLVMQIVGSVSIGDVSFTVYPHLMQFAQAVIRARRSHCFLPRPPQQKSPSATKKPSLYYVDFALTTKSFQFKAAAERLIIEYRTTGVSYASTSLLRRGPTGPSTWESSMTHSLAFSEIRLQACGVPDMSNTEEYSVLAALVLTGGRGNLIVNQEAQPTSVIRAIFGLKSLHLNVPRSAMRLYRFGEEWKADYLAAIDSEIHELLSELNQSRPKPQSLSSRTSNKSVNWNYQIHASLNRCRISLQVMHGTWLSWEISDNITYLTSHPGRRTVRAFGLRIGSQTFGISSHTSPLGTPSHMSVRFHLPAFSANGYHDGKQIHALALVEFFHLTVKPSHWDTLLTVQQKFGQDFNDFFKLIEETRLKSERLTNPEARAEVPRTPYGVSIKMKGFRVGLEGLTSTLFLECEDVNGGISSDAGFSWRLNLLDLALSLAPQVNLHTRTSPFDPDRRSAFVIIDFQINMMTQTIFKLPEKRLQIAVSKTHAVMQPSSVGELGDFIDHLQVEILIRKEQRANELAAFKEKTRSVMRTFDVKLGDGELQSTSWWDSYYITVSLRNVGIAFPLAHDSNLQLPRFGSQETATVRAFLFSIKSILFGTQRGESGEITMKGFSFQFVSRFRQSHPGDFLGENYQSRNRLLYPVMTAQLRSQQSQGSRRIFVSADVDGFILDLESTIPDYISSLIDVYNRGKERVEKLTNAIPRAQTTPPQTRSQGSDGYGAVLTSNIFLSLTFASGKVRMYSKASKPTPYRGRPLHTHTQEPSDQQSRELGAEVFNLPVVSVWGEYRATPALSKVTGSNRRPDPSMLLFKTTIHSSQNTLRPTLLPFLTELVKSIEDHMRTTTWRDSHASSISQDLASPSTITSPDVTAEIATEAVSSMQISLSLRIDQSKLELTCQPDVNVVAGLHWDSGGFVVNIWPGGRKVAFSGSVGGLTAGLKHGFLSEDCARLDAHNLAFSVDFSKQENELGEVSSSVSVVLDTEFFGGVRLSRFQDVLCFKAVWLDHIPMFHGQVSPPVSAVSRSTSHKSIRSPMQDFTTAVLLRLRKIRLDVDLGQSITSLDLSLDETIIRSKMTENVAEVSLSITQVSISAVGNLGGRVDLPDFRFQTVRRKKWTPGDTDGARMLDLGMTSGPLDIELESDYHKLLHYRAEPLEISIYDDWSRLTPYVEEQDRRVCLTFTVSGTDVVAMMNVGTIPKLVSYGDKFMANLDAQREGASRESQTFRAANPPKPDNRLSAVANAMLSSARSRLKEADTALSYVVGQSLRLKLRFLQLVVFPRSMNDGELAQLMGSDIQAQLDRLVESEALPAQRDLHLSFSSLTISKLSQLHQLMASKDKSLSSRDWLLVLTRGVPEATIFGLPSMNMWMRSDEEITESTRNITYDFSSTFNAKGSMQDPEDIFITLNMSLYSWLTILRKTFAREMSQVHAGAEGRVTGGQLTAQHRRKTTEVVCQSMKQSISSGLQALPKASNLKPPVIRDIELPLSATPQLSPTNPTFASLQVPSLFDDDKPQVITTTASSSKTANSIIYRPRSRHIERLTMRQLGEATPDITHPFFTKKAGFNLEDSLPQYVHEYATIPTEEIMKALLKLYSRQLKADVPRHMTP